MYIIVHTAMTVMTFIISVLINASTSTLLQTYTSHFYVFRADFSEIGSNKHLKLCVLSNLHKIFIKTFKNLRSRTLDCMRMYENINITKLQLFNRFNFILKMHTIIPIIESIY